MPNDLMPRLAWLALGALAITPALAAQGTAPVFDRLEGNWIGEGRLMNRPASFTMRWHRDGGFALLTFTNGFVDSLGNVAPVLSAAAVYRTGAGRPEGVWLDSRGVRIELAWEASDTVLVVTWTAPTETGRTTYRPRPDDTIDVLDEVQRQGQWYVFATALYRRRTRPGQ